MAKLLSLLLLACPLFGVGQVQQSTQQLGSSGNWVVAFNWTADASDGSVPVTAWSGSGTNGPQCCQGYFVTQVEIVPASPAPTTGYGVAVNDGGGADVLAGTAASLSATVAQSFVAATSATPVQGTLLLVIYY